MPIKSLSVDSLGTRNVDFSEKEKLQMQRKKTLTKPERNNLDDPNNVNHYYAQKVKTTENAVVLASTTGIDPFVANSLRENTIKRHNKRQQNDKSNVKQEHEKKLGRTDTCWIIYCYIVTFWVSSRIMKWFGMRTKERQMAWREKIALITVIFYCGAFITFLTFGFNTVLCKPKSLNLIPFNNIQQNQVTVHGFVYSSQEFDIFGIEEDIDGKDLSFLFQNVNGNCKGLIKSNQYDRDELPFYFPCTLSKNNIAESKCINSPNERKHFYSLKPVGEIMYSWKNISSIDNLRLVVYDGNVIDLNTISYLQDFHDITYPVEFDLLLQGYYNGNDISHFFSDYARGQQVGRCLVEIARIGTVDSETVGCVTSKAFLTISLILIIGIIFLKFLIAVYYSWVIAPKQGVCKKNKLTKQFSESSINSIKVDLNKLKKCKHTSVAIQEYIKNNSLDFGSFENENICASKSIISLGLDEENAFLPGSSTSHNGAKELIPPFSHTLNPSIVCKKALKQPNPDYMPFDFPLLHTICFVTCYSEAKEGIKSTLDSVCRTDYPNTHKLLMVVCDGLIKGSGNDKSTPEIVLDMIDNFTVDPKSVEPHSYVAVAFGSKRHNMAKVYSGFYKYEAETSKKTPLNLRKQTIESVPIICIVKCGTEEEREQSSKPGNRGKRDSQVILMSFLEKIFFNDRMSQLEYQILKNIWMVTGIMANYYELVLTIDADTVVFKDALKHMATEMCKDPEIMGLCGETQIENKLASWVTAIQVFEYFISHHQSKAFETVFATVTCLPGCFSMYRIKSPKGNKGFWVPLLANPDIVERYSDNVTNSLHKKNLLMLGEDRFLTSLLLKTFPKRKQVFLKKAICRTLVPDTFPVLLSQRRRWINSTIHNLMELLLVNDLCGVFCFSMQFLIFIELIGSLVLPLAISFTIYVIMFSIFSNPTPYLTLILLGVILGLPGVLIFLIGASLMNFVYMIIYIIALPIWNFVLPVYAFWKFDDFSWGETRVIEGENKHEDEVGLFDYTNIYMEDWREIARTEEV